MPQHTILIIDDNNEIRENTAEILSLAGYKTLTAENGKKGVDTAIREKGGSHAPAIRQFTTGAMVVDSFKMLKPPVKSANADQYQRES